MGERVSWEGSGEQEQAHKKVRHSSPKPGSAWVGREEGLGRPCVHAMPCHKVPAPCPKMPQHSVRACLPKCRRLEPSQTMKEYRRRSEGVMSGDARKEKTGLSVPQRPRRQANARAHHAQQSVHAPGASRCRIFHNSEC